MKVYKYTLTPKPELRYELFMPAGAEIIHVDMQRDHARMWAIVDPDKPFEKRIFHVFKTGEDYCHDRCKYIGTFITQDGDWVGHIFEVSEV